MKPFIDLQCLLRDLGVYDGEIDGVLGPKSAQGLFEAIAHKGLSVNDLRLAACRKIWLETPTRRTIEATYGVVKYKPAAKGAIKILNPEEWRKNFCRVNIALTGMEQPIELTVHDKIACPLMAAFAEIELRNATADASHTKWIPKVIQSYCARHNRWDDKEPLSVHTWAAAIDIDPKQNGIGMKTNIPIWVVKIFQKNGAVWGGTWTRYPDPMHFQWMR